MAELGNDTSTAAFRLTEKAFAAFLALLKYLIERHDKKIDRELKEAQIDELRSRTVASSLDGKVGYIKAKELLKTGEPLVGANITLNEEQMKDFARYAKKYGLLYTAFSDKTATGEKQRTFLVREKDLPTVKVITDRMAEDLNIDNLVKLKQKILDKGEENLHGIYLSKFNIQANPGNPMKYRQILIISKTKQVEASIYRLKIPPPLIRVQIISQI